LKLDSPTEATVRKGEGGGGEQQRPKKVFASAKMIEVLQWKT
jgi:hypothetical protein